MEAVREILQFLELSARIDLKTVALQHVLGLTGSPEGLDLLSNIPELVGATTTCLTYQWHKTKEGDTHSTSLLPITLLSHEFVNS